MYEQRNALHYELVARYVLTVLLPPIALLLWLPMLLAVTPTVNTFILVVARLDDLHVARL